MLTIGTIKLLWLASQNISLDILLILLVFCIGLKRYPNVRTKEIQSYVCTRVRNQNPSQSRGGVCGRKTISLSCCCSEEEEIIVGLSLSRVGV